MYVFSLRNLTCLWSRICLAKWSSWMIPIVWNASSRSVFWIGNNFSTMKRPSYVIFNWSVKILSERSWKIRVVFWVFCKIWSPFKFTNNGWRLECFWISGKSELIFYITNHIQILLSLSSDIVELLVSHFEVRINSFESFVLNNIKSVVPGWKASFVILLLALDS